ncbi:DedA family protein [Agromyces sp. Marseille-P2726]|uniref:DedA family protein n=1 Tax=Agromyces sp. Marseille-P2726 TaxID=2709132 RepID=UPI00156D94AC|nr:DedA family protein [Agromyces sp. Marseille-P2726]
MTLLAATADHGFTGLTGFAADILTALGEFGVGVLVFIEVLVPPIPSEVILPFAGYLSQAGELELGWLIAWSTVASLAGALVLYWLGAAVGMRRAVDLIVRTRLVSRTDLERGAEWFTRHGAWSVLVGRVIPGVRSLISIPAGAARMSLPRFCLYTVLGSGVWNTFLIGVGAALGTQHELLDQYLGYVDLVVYAAIALGLATLVVRRYLEHRRARADTDETARASVEAAAVAEVDRTR